MLASTSTVAVERELIYCGDSLITPIHALNASYCTDPLHVGVRSENTTKMELNSGTFESAIIPCIDSELEYQAVIVGSAEGDDVLIGASSWIKESCGVEGYYNVYARVSSVRAWIETITNGSCRP
ncbi:Serine protease trypsin-like protein [Phytophthora megakarya]|uniref:Serine protease trypsin-like protein n=1 Tax=Phytophthora megakarya TaxID=4795 RepID=A0A225UJJ8_9STRA|nr:Serine protease trypsin-like protein [Phytophthora megakarya]